mmetsp:Transcript_32970/g.72006  ORF Transcript_32970/g.72006 Transcript_32970/m.72006 type:complete len:186 (-) Transcript_32970:28-585(-)
MYWSMSTIPRLDILDWAARLWGEGPGTMIEQADCLTASERKGLATALRRGGTFFKLFGSVQARNGAESSVSSKLDDGVAYQKALQMVRQWTHDIPMNSVDLFSSVGWIEQVSRRCGFQGRQLSVPSDLLCFPLGDMEDRPVTSFVVDGSRSFYSRVGLSMVGSDAGRRSTQLGSFAMTDDVLLLD